MIELTHVWKQYQKSSWALSDVTLTIPKGEFCFITGPSGSGKSTLLKTFYREVLPTEGQVIIGGRDCATLSDRERTRVRRSEIGFVYQFHHLLPEFSALENVVIPQMINGTTRKAAAARAGASVCHVDAAKGMVEWCRDNAALSALAACRIISQPRGAVIRLAWPMHRSQECGSRAIASGPTTAVESE